MHHLPWYKQNQNIWTQLFGQLLQGRGAVLKQGVSSPKCLFKISRYWFNWWKKHNSYTLYCFKPMHFLFAKQGKGFVWCWTERDSKGHSTLLNYVNWPECMGGCAASIVLKDVNSRFTPILACRMPVRDAFVLNRLGLPLAQIS